ncbi:unnamed protein product [Ectocarpus sp. CCAP 1310/34]|nr:unnamed protein product [Ectocarpus sp. CCAP 1310/34]
MLERIKPRRRFDRLVESLSESQILHGIRPCHVVASMGCLNLNLNVRCCSDSFHVTLSIGWLNFVPKLRYWRC